MAATDVRLAAPTPRRARLDEITAMRGLACLAVVTLHALPGWVRHQGWNPYLWNDLRLLLTVGTPLFVFVSEFVLAYAYPERRPPEFWRKRLRFILLPYVSIGLLTALWATRADLGRFAPTARDILLGGWHGYFVLVVLQFYALHLFWQRYVRHLPKASVLAACVVANVAYLAVFNFTAAPSDHAIVLWLWGRGHWLLFPGWLAYFALAYWCGTDVERVRELTTRYYWALLTAVGGVAAGAVALRHAGVLGITSKRVDMIVLASLAALALFGWATRRGRVPPLLELISRYSFGIYLLHMFLLGQVAPHVRALFGVVSLPITIATVIALSIVTIAVVNRLPFGSSLVGRVLPPRPRSLAS